MNVKRITICGLTLAIAAAMTAGPVYADKPSWAGGGERHDKERHSRDRDKPGKHEKQTVRGKEWDHRHYAHRSGGHFTEHHRVVIERYYVHEFRGGHCPPGLAKKRNGCMPPGLAKTWHVGRPLPSQVIYYDLPPALIVQIGTPPVGYKYVRVASDILMIAVGTGMVVSAIEDLGRL